MVSARPSVVGSRTVITPLEFRYFGVSEIRSFCKAFLWRIRDPLIDPRLRESLRLQRVVPSSRGGDGSVLRHQQRRGRANPLNPLAVLLETFLRLSHAVNFTNCSLTTIIPTPNDWERDAWLGPRI
jgi:hypothetical protein